MVYPFRPQHTNSRLAGETRLEYTAIHFSLTPLTLETVRSQPTQRTTISDALYTMYPTGPSGYTSDVHHATEYIRQALRRTLGTYLMPSRSHIDCSTDWLLR